MYSSTSIIPLQVFAAHHRARAELAHGRSACQLSQLTVTEGTSQHYCLLLLVLTALLIINQVITITSYKPVAVLGLAAAKSNWVFCATSQLLGTGTGMRNSVFDRSDAHVGIPAPAVLAVAEHLGPRAPSVGAAHLTSHDSCAGHDTGRHSPSSLSVQT